MNKFTEGDWKAVSRGPLYGSDEIFEIHWSADGECVAEIVHGKADATLMAASKEMYEALEKWLRQFGSTNEMSIETRRILAKARGEV